MKKLHINKRILDLRYLSPWIKRLGGRENKYNLGTDETNNVEKTLSWSCGCWKWSDPLEEEHTGWEEIEMTNSMIKKDWYSHRSVRTPLGKNVWNQHLTLKQLEYHNSKTKQRIGLQNKPEQTYDRDFIRSFRGGAYTGSIVQHHHVQGSAHDIRSVPESA